MLPLEREQEAGSGHFLVWAPLVLCAAILPKNLNLAFPEDTSFPIPEEGRLQADIPSSPPRGATVSILNPRTELTLLV